MNLIRKGHRHTHRGVIGIESAIVLIAFVIVAAALAFVVLNMGFATTQKAKTSIIASLQEAGSSMQISGKVVGYSGGASPLNVITIPIKLTSGGDSVDLNQSRAKVSYIANTVEYDNIYEDGCTLNANGPFINVTAAWTDAAGGAAPDCAGVGGNPAANPSVDPTATRAIIYWTVGDADTLLEQGEHAVVSVAWDQAGPDERPASLDNVKVELTVDKGATLSIERQVPNISDPVVDLG